MTVAGVKFQASKSGELLIVDGVPCAYYVYGSNEFFKADFCVSKKQAANTIKWYLELFPNPNAKRPDPRSMPQNFFDAKMVPVGTQGKRGLAGFDVKRRTAQTGV